jgi:hypothetical protein
MCASHLLPSDSNTAITKAPKDCFSTPHPHILLPWIYLNIFNSFPQKNLYVFLVCLIQATCPASNSLMQQGPSWHASSPSSKQEIYHLSYNRFPLYPNESSPHHHVSFPFRFILILPSVMAYVSHIVLSFQVVRLKFVIRLPLYCKLNRHQVTCIKVLHHALSLTACSFSLILGSSTVISFRFIYFP